MKQTLQCWAVVPAAGVGKRMQADRPKQYLPLAGKTVIEHTLARLLASGAFQKVAVAISAEDPYWPELAVSKHPNVITALAARNAPIRYCLR